MIVLAGMLVFAIGVIIGVLLAVWALDREKQPPIIHKIIVADPIEVEDIDVHETHQVVWPMKREIPKA